MRKIIVGLIGLNLALAGYLAVGVARSTKGSKDASQPATDPTTVASGESAAPSKSAAATPISSPRVEKFSWASVFSKDPRVYAENLRRIGCPEETIKEILMAEVNRIYGAQEIALKVRPDDVAPWEKAALYDRRLAESKMRQLLEEKRNLLKELTGVDVGIDMPSRLAGRDVTKFEGGFNALPEDKRDTVRAIQENYWAQSDDIKQRTMGYLEPEDRAEFARIKQERKDALAKVLTPAELLDFEMKTSDTTPALKSRFEGFDTTPDEFAKIFEYMQPLDDQYSLSRRNPDPVNPEFTAARTQAEKDLEQQIRTVLGEDRFSEYQRTRDPAYRTLKKAGSEAGLPQETILQAYDAQRQIQEESKRIMQDSTLTAEQRAQGLQGIRDQAQQTIQQLFGDKAGQMMQKLPNLQMAERYGVRLNQISVNPTITTDVIHPPEP